MSSGARLQTDRLILRPARPDDWPVYRDFMMSERAQYLGSAGDLGASWKTFAAELGHWEIYGVGMWAVTMRDDDKIVGLVGPWTPPHWPENEIGWMMLSAETEGKGIAAEAARATLTHAFDVLGWETAVSYIWPGNDRSVRLAEKLGAVLDRDAVGPTADTLVYRHPHPGGSK